MGNGPICMALRTWIRVYRMSGIQCKGFAKIAALTCVSVCQKSPDDFWSPDWPPATKAGNFAVYSHTLSPPLDKHSSLLCDGCGL